MANVSRPGAWPVGTVSGSPWQGSVKELPVDAAATDIYVGDLVTLTATGICNAVGAHTGINILGACVGVKPVTGQSLGSTTLALAGNTEVALGQKYSSGAGTIFVCTAPDAIYEMDATAAVVGQSNVGQTVNIAFPTGSTTTGLSAHVINISQIGTSNLGQLRIVGIPNRVDNTTGAANCHVHVVVNWHTYEKGAAGV